MNKTVYTGRQDTTNYVSPEYIHVNSCGTQISRRKGYTLIRENGRVDYHILYNIHGKIMITGKDGKRMLKPGDGVIFKPHERQEYHFPRDAETATYWIHFSGFGVEKILGELGLSDKSFFRLASPRQTEELFRMAVEEMQLKKFQYAIMAGGLLLNILTNIARDIRNEKRQEPHTAIFPALSAINEHPELETPVSELAKLCCMSKSRFTHLFTSATGTSPHRFRLRLRIDRARDLLAYSDMTIADVAAEIGFSDSLYFSRLFKKYTALSPRAYRQKMRDDRL